LNGRSRNEKKGGNDLSIVADNVKRIIKENGLKQCYVEKKAGLGHKELSAMLSGRKGINAVHVIALARALACTPNELFGFEKTVTSAKPEACGGTA